MKRKAAKRTTRKSGRDVNKVNARGKSGKMPLTPLKIDGKMAITEVVDIAALRSHPRNYREHPEDQIDHLAQSMRENGVYRNVVIARDNVILAGHGVVKAASKIGLEKIPAIRLDVDSKDERALKILVGDNEIARLAMPDDRALTELLKELSEVDVGALLGTGFDGKMLAALTYVTRPASEIGSLDEAAHWAGMPEYSEGEIPLRVIIQFRGEEDREVFVKQFALKIGKKQSKTWSTWWPEKERDDASSVSFVENEP